MTTRLQRILFWILLGLYSTFFAEIVSGSTLFPFFKPYGYFLVIPVYLLHTIFFLSIIYRYGKPNIQTLYLGGMLFGLYEAYITKVLWAPHWTDPLYLGGVGVLSFLLLVIWWHPLLSFITPSLIGERTLTNSSTISQYLPQRIKKIFSHQHFPKFFIGILILSGLILGAKLETPAIPLLALLSGGIILTILTIIWRKTTNPAPLTELLPTKNEFIVLSGLLGIFYIITGIFIFPENFPSLKGHITIIILYIIIGTLFILNLRKGKTIPLQKSQRELSFKHILLGIAAISIGTLLASFVPVIGNIFAGLTVLLGVILFVKSIKNALF